MDTANNDNQVHDTDTSTIEGVDSVESVDDDVPGDILGSINELRNEQNEALDEYVEGDDPDETGDQGIDDDSPEEPASKDDEEASEQWKSIAAHLMTKGLSAEDIEGMSDKVAQKVAESMGWSAEPESADESKPSGEQEDAPAAFDHDAMVQAVNEKLSVSFEGEEASSLNEAIVTAVSMARGAFPEQAELDSRFSQYERTQVGLSNMIENLLIDQEIPRLAETYPDISEDGGREKVIGRAKVMLESGMKADSIGDLLRYAATIEFGQKAAKRQQQFAKKVSKSRKVGQPTGKRGGRDTASTPDDKGLDLVKEWQSKNT